MSIGFNPGFGFDDADDVARSTAFRKRIDKSSPLTNPEPAGHEGQIDVVVSPRDPQTGLPTGQVWDDTDIVHVVSENAATANMYGDIEFDVVARPELGDSGTHEVGHALGKQDVEVENDESHFTERSAQPGHVRGAIQKRLPGTSAESFTYQRIEMENSVVDEPGPDEPSANESMSLNFEEVKQQIRSEFPDDGDGVWEDDWESPVN